MSTDFSSPAAVVTLLLRQACHYLNVQSRHVLGVDFAEISDDEIARRLATYTYVASETDLAHTLSGRSVSLSFPKASPDSARM